MKIHSQAPCRVDLAGGTLDSWPLYLFHESAVTVNFAVDRYTHARIEPRLGGKITLRSADLNRDAAYDSLDHLIIAKKHILPLVGEIVRFFRPKSGFHLETGSEAPAGAGISGSSALIVATTSAFNKWLKRGYSLEALREISQNIEARLIRVPTGCQDYYPAMYGAVNAIELGCGGIRRVALDVAPRCAVEKHDWTEVARLLREEWSHRKQNAPGISTPLIDRLIQVTRRKGALAAKVCGAGGGGCVLFFVEPYARTRVAALIEKEGATVLPVKIARRGVEVGVSK
jgi:D-glycero-alpha-D-manno-heptose-7-phosphate kinase